MEKDVVSLASELISIHSTKEDLKALREILITTQNKLRGFGSKFYENNETPSLLYFNTKKIPSRFRILLNSHLDVVPAMESQFKVWIKNDRLSGRGASDMKAAAAVQILVFSELANTVNYPLGLQLVTDEEIGGYNGTKHQIDKGIRADFVIAGEPSNLEIVNQTKGIYWVKLISTGSSAHGAYPWLGINSIQLLNIALSNIWKIYKIPGKESWKTTINVGHICSQNETFNKVPDRCEAWLDIRYIPKDADSVLINIKKVLPKGVLMEEILKEIPHNTKRTNKYINALAKSYFSVTGKNIKVLRRHGANDVRHFNKVGCDGIEFGPAGHGMHTNNEWVSVKSLLLYYKILKDFLLSVN